MTTSCDEPAPPGHGESAVDVHHPLTWLVELIELAAAEEQAPEDHTSQPADEAQALAGAAAEAAMVPLLSRSSAATGAVTLDGGFCPPAG